MLSSYSIRRIKAAGCDHCFSNVQKTILFKLRNVTTVRNVSTVAKYLFAVKRF